ncbi:MAG: DUF4388 domain-containing protein [Acidobacteriota bacterium]
MSINGILEDLPLADVLQFVHLGRRTGTLYMWRDDDHRAEIGFHDGKIVNTWTPGQKKLGDLLVSAGLLSAENLAQGLETQRTGGDGISLGQVLLDRKVITRGQVHQVIREQVEKTIFELVTWRHGNFHFEVDELNPIDDFSLAPMELLRDLDLNTQMLLLEATRIFDERSQADTAVKAPRSPALSADLDRRLQRAGFARHRPGSGGAPPPEPGAERGEAETGGPQAVRCQVVSEDGSLLEELRRDLPTGLVRVVPVRLREAGTRLPGHAVSPIVVLDLRHGGLGIDDVASLARTRPSAPLLVVAADDGEAMEARRAGAITALVAGDPTLADSIRNTTRVFSHPQPQGTFGYQARGGFSRFRRVVFDVQSGLLSATMALNLMHVISESVERAVLFLVQGDELKAVGAFGFSLDGQPLAGSTRNLRLELGTHGALRSALERAAPQSIPWDDAELPEPLGEILGKPASGQVVIFPVLGAERPISVIYTDNGQRNQDIEDIRILELATSQVGVAFENELLRQELGDLGDLEPDLFGDRGPFTEAG